MKKLNILLIALVTLAGSLVSNPAAAQPGYDNGYDNPNFSNFYNELSPYGRWVNMPRYGRVWIYSEPGFRPYSTNGQWINTDQGWSWESNYDWGGIPFHYGRWELDSYYGWMWIPGYEYAPAWVTWSEADDYYGWAPLGFGMDINISLGRIPTNRWMYAQRGYMGYNRIDNYCVPYSRNSFYYQRQRPVVNIYSHNNVRYLGGPRYNNNNHGNNYGSNYGNNNGRPQVRPQQYGNNNNNGNYNNGGNRPTPNNQPNNNNNNGYDRSRIDRSRAYGGERPERTNTRPDVQERPNVEQRRENIPAPNNQPARPEVNRSAPAPQRNYEPRVNINSNNSNNQSRPAPAARESSNNNGGGRNPMIGERRVR